MVNFKYFLFFSAIILFVVIFYQWLTKYLRRNDITVKFAYLFPFEEPFFSHKGRIKIDVAIDGMVRAEIISTSGETLMVAFEEWLTSGIQVREIDFSTLNTGNYVLKIVFPDQTITRYIQIHQG